MPTALAVFRLVQSRAGRKVKPAIRPIRVLGAGASIELRRGDRMRNGSRLLFAAAASIALAATAVSAGATDRKAIERGKYLVSFGGCFDCHTPGYFFASPTWRIISAAPTSASRCRGLG